MCCWGGKCDGIDSISGGTWKVLDTGSLFYDDCGWRDLQRNRKRWILHRKIFVVLLSVYASVRFVAAVYDINRTYTEVSRQIEMIEEQKAQGIMDVKICPLSPSTNISNATSKTPDVSLGKDDWFNEWMACYYGVDSITGMERGDCQ